MLSFISKTENTKIPKWYLIALLATLSVRFVLIGVSIHNGTSPSLPQDPLQYKILAINTYEHGRFTLDISDPENYDLLRTPAYPLFLGPFILLDHSGYLAVMVQQILSLFTVYLIYLIIFYLTKRKNLAGILSLIFFLWPYDILWSRMTMSETLFTFLLVISVYFIIKRQDRNSDIIAGVFTGIMLLTRPQGILFFPIIMLVVLFMGPKRRMWLYPTIVLLCLLPWLHRNYELTKSVTLSSSGTLNMIFGGIAGEDAWNKLWALDLEKSKMVKDPFSNNSTTDWWSYTTKGYEPMLKLVKDGHASFESMIVKNLSCSTKIWSADEVQVLFHRLPQPVQKTISVFYELFLWLSFIIIAFGSYLSIKTRERKTIILLLLTVGIVLSGTFVNMCIAYGRMNIPLVPFLLIAVGLGINTILSSSKKS